MCVQQKKNTHTHTRTHTHKHTHVHRHTYAHTYTRVLTDTQTTRQTHVRTQTYPQRTSGWSCCLSVCMPGLPVPQPCLAYLCASDQLPVPHHCLFTVPVPHSCQCQSCSPVPFHTLAHVSLVHRSRFTLLPMSALFAFPVPHSCPCQLCSQLPVRHSYSC